MELDLKSFGITEAQLKRLLRGKGIKPRIIKSHSDSNTLIFAVVSDTHFCSTEERVNELHTFYNLCVEKGIKTFVHAGDIVAGWGIYRGQENEVHTFGAQNQAEYVIKHYPKIKDVKTYFCTGNHDLSWWIRSGIDVGEIIAHERPDMIYLGQYAGELEINGIKISLLHPDKGGAYAISYNLQKIVEQIPSGRKPHILIAGHYHTSLYFFYRLIHCFQAGCFEGQTSFLLRKGINPVIGGWIVKVNIANDKKHTITSLTPTFVPFIKNGG